MKKIKISKRFLIILTIILFFNYTFVLSVNSNEYIQYVNSSTQRTVNPIGRTIGLKLYTDGVLVVGMSEIDGADGNKYKPYEESGIKEGDMIKTINGKTISNTDELINTINESNGNAISIRYQRESEEIYTTINPIKSIDGNYMIGLWVRDAAAGIGTLTYYEEATSTFAALGHGINDVDTNKLLNISNGELVTSQIVSIVKGEKGKPGEIRGIIEGSETIGNIEVNSVIGIYGKVTNFSYINKVKKEEIPVANRKQIKEGKAKVICQLTNEDKTEEYDIEIKKIYRTNYTDNKSMLIKITDERLIEKTGGIIPGMSGTPIVQDGRFIGAITNVLLNDPTQGYAIFADMMMQ